MCDIPPSFDGGDDDNWTIPAPKHQTAQGIGNRGFSSFSLPTKGDLALVTGGLYLMYIGFQTMRHVPNSKMNGLALMGAGAAVAGSVTALYFGML